MSTIPVESSVIKKSYQSSQLATREYNNQISTQNQKIFGDIIYRITDHSERITGISFSPNSSLLVSCDLKSILVTDLYNGQVEELVHTDNSAYLSLAISPDGSTIAIGEKLPTRFKVRILNINTKKEVNNIDIEHLNSLLYSPDGLKIAVISENAPEIKIFSAYSSDLINNLKTESRRVQIHSIDFSPDGSCIVSSLEERFFDPLKMTDVANYSLTIWDMNNEAIYRTIRNSARMESVKFSSDGMLFASGGADGVLKLWDTHNGKLIWEKSDHDSHVINSIDFSSDSMTLTSGDANGIIKVRNITNGEVIAEFADQSGEGILAVVYSPDSTLLASATRKEDGGSIILRNMARGVEKEPELYLHGDVVHSTAISPDGLKIASGSADGTVKLKIGNNNPVLENHGGTVKTVVFSANNVVLASGSSDGTIKIWDISQGRLDWIKTLSTQSEIYSISFSPNGLYLASNMNKAVQIWQTTTWANTTLPHNSDVSSVCFSPNGSILASGDTDNRIKFWNTTNWKNIFDLTWNSAAGTELCCIDFSNNGTLLAAGGRNYINQQAIKLWNLFTGEDFSLNWTGDVYCLDFSANDKIFGSASYDWNRRVGTIRFWNSTTGDVVYSFPEVDQKFYSLAFSPDKFKFVSSSGEAIVFWNLSTTPWDYDGDSMSDEWENYYFLDYLDFWDKFNDSDNDGLINSLEYFLNTNPLLFDTDNDSMSDGWEYHNQLDPKIDDASRDFDNDGMPNFWEFQYDFQAFNPADALWDSDKDWIINLEEYMEGTNPRNFWSVPLLKFSAVHFLAMITMIILLLCFFLITGYIKLQEKRKVTLVKRLNAPDFQTARLIQHLGLSNFSELQNERNKAIEIIEKGRILYLNGHLLQANQNYKQVLIRFSSILDQQTISETVFNSAWLKRETGLLEKNDPISDYFPQPPYNDLIVVAYRNMLDALFAEENKNWGLAREFWQAAVEYEGIIPEYIALCKGSLINLEFRDWLNDPIRPTHNKLTLKVEELQRFCETNNLVESLCQTFLIHARIELAALNFDEAELWIQKCKQIATKNEFNYYKEKASREEELFKNHKENIHSQIERETEPLAPIKHVDLVRKYLAKVKAWYDEYLDEEKE